MEQIIVLALVAAFFVVKNILAKRFGGAAAEPTAEPTPPPIIRRTTSAPVRRSAQAPVRTEQEEKMRKFFEALGLPTDSLPPAPFAPKAPPPAPTHRPTATPPPMQVKAKPKRASEPPPYTRPDFMPAAAESISVGAGPLAPASPASPAEMYASMAISAPSLRPESRRDRSPAAAIALELISSPRSAQRAIVLNELFSKPLALR